VYVADSGNAPYGDARGDAFVRQRSLAIADYLCRTHHIKALVVACNTATAVAVEPLRAMWPTLSIVGVEPALGPAARASRTHCVGVLATRTTLASQRFQHLLASHSQGTRFTLQACDGLAQAIEARMAAPYPAQAEEATLWQLCAHYVAALGVVDSLVLGCTHYELMETDIWRYLLGPEGRIWSCAEAVARQTRRVLEQADLLTQAHTSEHSLRLYTTGTHAALQAAAGFCLGHYAWDYQCEAITCI